MDTNNEYPTSFPTISVRYLVRVVSVVVIVKDSKVGRYIAPECRYG